MPVSANFRDATRRQAKACITIEGLAGSGKSGLALAIGYVLADNDFSKVYANDTENRSLDLFEGIQLHTGVPITPFKKLDLLPLDGYAPSNYHAIKEAAKRAGALVFIQDSISHMWQSTGGVLDLVSQAKAKDAATARDNYRVWGLPEIVKEKNLIFSCIRDADVHMISTIRVKEKQEFVQEDGKNVLKSLGEQQIQMPDLKYEPDLVLAMVTPGKINGTAPVAKVLKTRYAIFEKDKEYAFTESLILQLKAYLAEGADPEELKEQQRLEMVASMTAHLDSNASARTILPMLKEQMGMDKDKKLADMTLNELRTLWSMLVS